VTLDGEVTMVAGATRSASRASTCGREPRRRRSMLVDDDLRHRFTDDASFPRVRKSLW
jgi:hypothetical protein